MLSQYPDARIETEPLRYDETVAAARAVVTLPTGASASGLGSEVPKDFGDYLEKAETKAVGQALGMLGFGTAFRLELDDARIADGPLARLAPRR